MATARCNDSSATEETLILLLRTYLQRVSSKLSAAEFVELTKAAIAFLNTDQPESDLSESKRLLYVALQTFGTQLSQPIPPLGEKIPKKIASLMTRLVRYQQIIAAAGVRAILTRLAAQSPDNQAQQLTPSSICTVLEENNVRIDTDIKAGLDDLVSVLLLERQLQTYLSAATQSEQAIVKQVNQAIAEFKAKYQSPAQLIQPQWNSELSVSSSWFNPDNFETAGNDFDELPPSHSEKTSKDATNP